MRIPLLIVTGAFGSMLLSANLATPLYAGYSSGTQGMISGAATAALSELVRGHDARRAALLATLAQSGGSAGGPLLAGMLAQWAPAVRRARRAARVAGGSSAPGSARKSAPTPREWA